jgi:hypothetical protein
MNLSTSTKVPQAQSPCVQDAAPDSVNPSDDADTSRRTKQTQPLQLTLDDAIAAGTEGMAQATDAAVLKDPIFMEKAIEAILRHLQASPDRCAPGEELVDVARAHGAQCKDGRAFGSVFQALMRRGLIRCLRSDLPRKRGHGTSGGKLWALCQ